MERTLTKANESDGGVRWISYLSDGERDTASFPFSGTCGSFPLETRRVARGNQSGRVSYPSAIQRPSSMPGLYIVRSADRILLMAAKPWQVDTVLLLLMLLSVPQDEGGGEDSRHHPSLCRRLVHLRSVVVVMCMLYLYSILSPEYNLHLFSFLAASEPVKENRPDDVVGMAPQLSPPLPITAIGSKNSSSPISLTVLAGLTKRSFTYQELVIATNNFSAVNLLGEGGFSHVYKGTLSNGTEAAIKRLKDTSKQTDVEFMKEADILSLVHHRHLVSLIGCCISEGNWLLVCEYVPNKTLKFHLHDREQPTLAWKDRFRIALDSAKGLAYLHEDCQPRVIHRDIKAANILLDHSFRAKIADFGIAKHFSDEKTHISTVVKGTHGYLSPEYVSTGKLTDKSDVFSYGVLLLELITGRRPVHLADWARPLLKQALEDGKYDVLVDPFLESYYNPIELERMVACAYACLYHSASLRPSMSQILKSSIEDSNRN
ncbi:STYKc [Musa troglodytarum]|uniref:non-specific serine/threonine protein kinase n=1 Tax=Musa troglodytarum TaxID=320322 RepID=A0A9E7GZ38_9LILI|nr:STYKc [Musa troglodytarum]